MITDPVGDFIIRLKNASMLGREHVSVPHSKLKLSIAHKLEERGYVKAIVKRGKKARKNLEIDLCYDTSGKPLIQEVKRVSKPGRRVYTRVSHIRSVRGGKGILFLSTPMGILTGEEARKAKVGGEALFKIW